MLEIQNLSLALPKSSHLSEPTLAVSNVSFSLQRGRVLGLVGESGCGKTLTAQAILRLGEHQGISRENGDILYDGQSIFSMSHAELRKVRGGKVSMVFQEPMTALNPVFSVGYQLQEVIRLHLNLSADETRKRAIQLLEDVGLEQAELLLEQYPDSLSGGMRQRVLIAMAMAANPDFIIADEPTTALDVSVQKKIIRLLRELQQKSQLGMLLVTHDFGLVAEMCDDVAVMYAGEIVEQGSVASVFDQPVHPYTKALMACRPELNPRGRLLPVIEGNVPAPGNWPSGCRFSSRCRWTESACQSAIALDAWHHHEHVARCVRVEEVMKHAQG